MAGWTEVEGDGRREVAARMRDEAAGRDDEARGGAARVRRWNERASDMAALQRVALVERES